MTLRGRIAGSSGPRQGGGAVPTIPSAVYELMAFRDLCAAFARAKEDTAELLHQIETYAGLKFLLTTSLDQIDPQIVAPLYSRGTWSHKALFCTQKTRQWCEQTITRRQKWPKPKLQKLLKK
ncbi:MAG: hypothetical protein EAZ29_05880 [Runella slithyformis]|nr:MAG: hypothetical protein EAZ29_05880 [Runella slithyformis]